MFRLEGTEKEKAILEKYLPNYRINLVDAERLEVTERFSEDLQVILTMLKYRKDKDGLRNYVNENKQFFQKVDHETSQAMKAFLNMKQIPGETENEEEIINMCEAIQEMYDDGVRDGMKRGIQQGRDDLLKEKVKRKLQKQKSLEQIADELEEDVKVITVDRSTSGLYCVCVTIHDELCTKCKVAWCCTCNTLNRRST